MRIAIIADIHGNLAALEAVLADAQRQGAEEILCLGDVAFKGPQPAECVDRLRELAIPCVQGNTDRWLARGLTEELAARWPETAAEVEWCRQQLGPDRLAWLGQLPFGHIAELEGLQALLVHGSPRSDEEFTYPWLTDEELAPLLAGVDEAVVCIGHHHLPMVRRALGKWIVGPGSVGRPVDGDPRAAYALLADAPDGRLAVTLVRTVYDVEATLAVAAERKIPGLQHYPTALRTGRQG